MYGVPKIHYKGQQGEFYVIIMGEEGGLGHTCGLLQRCSLNVRMDGQVNGWPGEWMVR